MPASWYLAFTHPSREESAAAYLKRLGYRVLWPRYMGTRRHAGQSQAMLRSLLPRHVLVEVDPDRTRWQTVQTVAGVVYLYPNGLRPAPCPRGLVRMLESIAGPDGLIPGQYPLLALPGVLELLSAGDDEVRLRLLLAPLLERLPPGSVEARAL